MGLYSAVLQSRVVGSIPDFGLQGSCFWCVFGDAGDHED